MLRKFIAAAIATVAAQSAFVSAAAQDMPKEISFGIISTESSQNLKSDWAPVVADMEKAIGIPVKPFFASDYAGVIEGMRFNKVQIAWMGNKSAMEAVDRSNGEVFAKVVNGDGTLGYYSMVSVHKDSPYKTLDDVLKNSKNINFGIGDPNSTSGFLVPSYYIFAQNKMDPKTSFKSIRSANHEANILAVANKQVDAAVHSSDVLERIEKRSPEVAANLRQVWKSPLISADPMVVRADLNPELKNRIRKFFVQYGRDDREKAQLAKLTFSGFRESNNDQLNPVRQLELFREKTKLEADTTIATADKTKRIEEIERKLASIPRS